jgi:hypothetical protein
MLHNRCTKHHEYLLRDLLIDPAQRPPRRVGPELAIPQFASVTRDAVWGPNNGDEYAPTCGCAPNEVSTGSVLALSIMAADGAVDDRCRLERPFRRHHLS